MTPDTQFILDEIAKLFTQQNAKWDQRFADRDAKFDQRRISRGVSIPTQGAQELPPSPAASKASTTTSPSITTTDAPPPSATAASTATITSIDSVARGAKDGIDINSPSRCSMVCHSAIARGLVPMSTTESTTTAFGDTVAVDSSSKVAGAQVPVEQFAKGVDLHEFIDGGLAASRPRRAPLRPPRPRRPRRAPLRAPRPRRPRRPPLRVPRLRRPRRAPPRLPRPPLRLIRLRRPRRHPPRSPWRAPPRAPLPRLSLSCATTKNSPTMCSTQCLNRDITLALRSAVFPLGVHKACLLKSTEIRYNTSCYHLHLIGVVPVGVATDAREVCMMLEIVTELNPAIPWPFPRQDSNTLISEIIQLCFIFWLPFSCGLAGLQCGLAGLPVDLAIKGYIVVEKKELPRFVPISSLLGLPSISFANVWFDMHCTVDYWQVNSWALSSSMHASVEAEKVYGSAKFASCNVFMESQPPWPPPVQVRDMGSTAELRPLPWPSFGCNPSAELLMKPSWSPPALSLGEFCIDNIRHGQSEMIHGFLLEALSWLYLDWSLPIFSAQKNLKIWALSLKCRKYVRFGHLKTPGSPHALQFCVCLLFSSNAGQLVGAHNEEELGTYGPEFNDETTQVNIVSKRPDVLLLLLLLSLSTILQKNQSHRCVLMQLAPRSMRAEVSMLSSLQMYDVDECSAKGCVDWLWRTPGLHLTHKHFVEHLLDEVLLFGYGASKGQCTCITLELLEYLNCLQDLQVQETSRISDKESCDQELFEQSVNSLILVQWNLADQHKPVKKNRHKMGDCTFTFDPGGYPVICCQAETQETPP